MKKCSIYIHIPFCIKKCPYCNFNSYKTERNTPVPDWYINSLVKEFKLHRSGAYKNYSSLKSIYFGGGTPSLLSERQIKRILSTVHESFNIKSRKVETTVEINPGTADIEKIYKFYDSGVNRFTIGVQSFRDSELKSLGRVHSSKESTSLLESLKKSSITNYGLDIIYGIPGQTVKTLLLSLEKALKFSPKHISAYSLTLENNTPLALSVSQGLIKIPSERIQLDMFKATISRLKRARFNHYEISNFAKSGFESTHNTMYWKREAYIGIGAGAHSFLPDKKLRSWNVEKPNQYRSMIRKDILPQLSSEVLDINSEKLEKLFLSLRTSQGIQKSIFNPQKRSQASVIIDKYVDSGYLNVSKRRINLTPRGLFVSNEIIERLSYFL